MIKFVGGPSTVLSLTLKSGTFVMSLIVGQGHVQSDVNHHQVCAQTPSSAVPDFETFVMALQVLLCWTGTYSV